MEHKLPPVNIELLVRCLVEREAETYVPSQLESINDHMSRRRAMLTESLQRTFAQAEAGYALLLKELETDSERNMKPFLLDPKHPVEIDSKKPIILYELFGWSQEVLDELYSAAKRIYVKQDSQEAIDAFSFLTTINPLIAEFWSALASAYEKDEKLDEASDAHEIALYLNPKEPALRMAATAFHQRRKTLGAL